jgi:hypothetical protein
MKGENNVLRLVDMGVFALENDIQSIPHFIDPDRRHKACDGSAC